MSDRKKRHDSIQDKERERGGGVGSAEKTLRVALAGAPVKSLGSSEMLVFFFSFTWLRLCHLIFKCRGNQRRAPPRPPAEPPGISQRAPTRSTRCRASACTGGCEATHPHRSRPSLACAPIHTRELCVCLSLLHTYTHHTCAQRLTCFPSL